MAHDEATRAHGGAGDLATEYKERIRDYFAACNDADVDGIARCFTDDAVHYFPPGMYEGPWRGARIIAQRWAHFVETLGSAWTIDRIVCEPGSHQAVIEWTHYKTLVGEVLRGDEWYAFDPDSALISEIRAYYAAPRPDGVARVELEGFDYGARGYHVDSPVRR